MSTSSSSDLSAASTKVNGDLNPPKERQSRSRKAVASVAQSTSAQDVLLFLVAFRILNALTISTFFQPDEYFQSLEPAWRMVFGQDSGAWITWEWRNALRSAIHPAIFATVYYLASLVADLLRLTPATRADLFLAAPKTLQGVFAALGDYYTWRLGQRVFGHNSHQAWAALALTVFSPWQWFCSTRTLSNCLETTLTIAALYNWPWQWSLVDRDHVRYDSDGLRVREGAENGSVDETTRLRRSLLLAALATILRPTNLLIWMTLAIMTCLQMSSRGWLARLPWTEQSILVEFTSPSFLRATTRERTKLVIETILCGSSILILSVLVDRFYYQFWTFPPLKFIYFNVVQSLSVFYGTNDWHYYLSQGYPLLLTTAAPFAVLGIYHGFFSTNSTRPPLTKVILSQFATISCIVPAALSLISHKEVRFIYPLLPLLHILAAEPLTRFFALSILHSIRSRRNHSYAILRRTLLGLLVLLNASISLYTTTIHNRGVLDVLSYLRHQHETYYLPHDKTFNRLSTTNLTVAFLMPCHSTPWRSHLVHPEIESWALTCEPPLDLSPEAKETYLDEADIFYADPMLWLRQNMSRQPPPRTRPRGLISIPRGNSRLDTPGARSSKMEREHGHSDSGRKEHHPWPDYLVFFAQAERTMDLALRGSGYAECWRGFNTRWHDDWRRTGDVVVWCLWPERRDRENKQSVANRFGQTLQSVKAFAPWAARSTPEILLGHQKHISGNVPATSSRDRDTRDSVLGGAKGPWGIGKSQRPDMKPSTWWEPLRSRWAQWREGHKRTTKKKRDVWS